MQNLDRPRRARGAATRERLLRIASELFADRGFARVTIGQIAEAAGVNRALIAYHFSDKGGLYNAIIDDAVRRACEVFEQHNAEQSSGRRLVEALGNVYGGNPNFARMLLREMLDPEQLLEPDAAAALGGFFQLTQRALADGEGPQGDPHLVHLICVGAIIYFQATAAFRLGAAKHFPSGAGEPRLKDLTALLSKLLERREAVD